MSVDCKQSGLITSGERSKPRNNARASNEAARRWGGGGGGGGGKESSPLYLRLSPTCHSGVTSRDIPLNAEHTCRLKVEK